MSRLFLTIFLVQSQWANTVLAQEYNLLEDISYYGKSVNDSYQKERCQLDVYYPKEIKNFPTVVWFHGGGLKAGNKSVPNLLKEKRIASTAASLH